MKSVRTAQFPLCSAGSSLLQREWKPTTVTSSLNSHTAAKILYFIWKLRTKRWKIFILICHLLWHINPRKGRMDGRKEGRGRRKKAAPADSCVPPPLLLHWSGGGLSDLLKGTDQNNCSVQENTSHSSPRTPLWLHSNSTLLHMTDGSRALSLSSPLFCRGGWGRGRWRWRWGRLETTEERYSFDLILICPRHQEQPQE